MLYIFSLWLGIMNFLHLVISAGDFRMKYSIFSLGVNKLEATHSVYCLGLQHVATELMVYSTLV